MVFGSYKHSGESTFRTPLLHVYECECVFGVLEVNVWKSIGCLVQSKEKVMSKVSIISVNYNQPEVTLELLESLEKQDYQDLEIIVVDNDSKLDPTRLIHDQYPEVKVIRSDQNLGFAGGNNLGIKEASGDFLFFLNNDTEVPNGTIKALVDAFSLNPKTGVVCPIINYFDQPGLTQYAGYTAINSLTGRNQAIGYKQQVQPKLRISETHYAHGAAMMVRREVVDQVGLMPENYFLYYEELDWGAQIKKAGYKIQVVQSVFILHKESVSTGKASPLKTYFQTRNRLLFMRRNMSLTQKVMFYCFFLCVALPKNVLQFVFRREIEVNK